MRSKINPSTIILYSIITLGLFSAYPYVFNRFLPIPSLSFVTAALFFSLIYIFFSFKNRLVKLPSTLTGVAITQILGWLFFAVYHNDASYFSKIIYIILVYLMLWGLQNSWGGIKRYMKYYNNWILLMAIGGSICFFLVLLFNLTPIFKFANMDGREAYFYGLTCTNTIQGHIIRYAGYFDEPGAMAYWGVWAIIFNVLFFHKKFFNNILLSCLVFTLSMAYYVQLPFIILFYKLNSIKQYILVGFICAFVVVSIPYIKSNNPILYRLTIGRFELNDSGKLKGDNRSNLAEIAKTHFLTSPLFGIGMKNSQNVESISDNPYETLAKDGIVGTIITYLPFIILWFKGDRKMKYAIIVLAIGYLQRPFHPYLLYYFILYSFLLMSLNKFKYEVSNIRDRR